MICMLYNVYSVYFIYYIYTGKKNSGRRRRIRRPRRRGRRRGEEKRNKNTTPKLRKMHIPEFYGLRQTFDSSRLLSLTHSLTISLSFFLRCQPKNIACFALLHHHVDYFGFQILYSIRYSYTSFTAACSLTRSLTHSLIRLSKGI